MIKPTKNQPTKKSTKQTPLTSKKKLSVTKKKSTATIKPTKRKNLKPKVAFYWCSSCGGCEEAIVDFDEKILDIVDQIDIVFWPCAMDFKTSDIHALKDNELTVSFINGAIRTSEQEEMAKLLRKKSQLVIAFGMCAYQGGIPALANLTNKTEIISRAYLEAETVSNPDKTLPSEKTTINNHELSLPHFYDTVYKLNDVINVDYFLPGCPPTVNIIEDALTALLTGKLPSKGSVVAPNHSLCKSCKRNDTKPDHLIINEIKRIHQVIATPDKCFLAQGILCMGPATRDGCGQLCINGNMPCTGCFGPLNNMDQGAKLIASFGGIYEGENAHSIEQLINSVVDPAGTFYRYGLSASLLGKKRKESIHDK